jgi:hypothetical protein
MYEQHVSSPEPAVWPRTPHKDQRPADGQVHGCPTAITDVISVIGDSRRLILISSGLLVGDLVGAGSVASALLGRDHVLALVSLCLLLPVVLSWLVTAAIVLLAERPITGALGELRRATGAPVDLSAPWSPLGARQAAASDLDRSHFARLIATANCQHTRARLALSASVLTTAAFFLWMSVALAAAMLI